MGTEWSLTAPATVILVALPPAGGVPLPMGAGPAPVTVALQELLQRGALTLDVVRDGVMLTEATIGPGVDPGDLPPALGDLRRSLLPFTPGAARYVLTKAHRRNPLLATDVRRAARRELTDGGLIEEHPARRFPRRRPAGWTRTEAGDALASEGADRLERLRQRQDEVDKDSEGGIAALIAADDALYREERIEIEGMNRHEPHGAGTWLGGN